MNLDVVGFDHSDVEMFIIYICCILYMCEICCFISINVEIIDEYHVSSSISQQKTSMENAG